MVARRAGCVVLAAAHALAALQLIAFFSMAVAGAAAVHLGFVVL